LKEKTSLEKEREEKKKDRKGRNGEKL